MGLFCVKFVGSQVAKAFHDPKKKTEFLNHQIWIVWAMLVEVA